MYPKNYQYTKEHEWLSIDGNIAVVGITQHAQEQLGDIVYVELPEPGDRFEAGQEFGSVESVKAVAEVFMPKTGEITGINEALEESPDLVNKAPHDEGWLIKIRLDDDVDLTDLMDSEAYNLYVEQETK